MKFYSTVKPIAFLASANNHINSPNFEKSIGNRFQILARQPTAKTYTSVRHIKNPKHDAQEIGDHNSNKHTAQAEQLGSNEHENHFIVQRIRPLQLIIENRMSDSIRHLLNGFMTGNVPNLILHGTSAYILISILDKLDACIGKHPDTQKQDSKVDDLNNTTEEFQSTDTENTKKPKNENPIVTTIINNLTLLLSDTPITRSLNTIDLIRLRSCAVIRLLQAEISNPGILTDKENASIAPNESESINKIFQQFAKQFRLFSDTNSPVINDTGTQDKDTISMLETSLMVILEKPNGTNFPSGFCDPKHKFECALRLLNAEIKDPGILNRGQDTKDSKQYTAVAKLYNELVNTDLIDLFFDINTCPNNN